MRGIWKKKIIAKCHVFAPTHEHKPRALFHDKLVMEFKGCLFRQIRKLLSIPSVWWVWLWYCTIWRPSFLRGAGAERRRRGTNHLAWRHDANHLAWRQNGIDLPTGIDSRNPKLLSRLITRCFSWNANWKVGWTANHLVDYRREVTGVCKWY